MRVSYFSSQLLHNGIATRRRETKSSRPIIAPCPRPKKVASRVPGRLVMMIEYAQYAHPWPRVGLFRRLRPRSWRAVASVPRHHGRDDTGFVTACSDTHRAEAINAASGPRIKAGKPGLERNPYCSHALLPQSLSLS